MERNIQHSTFNAQRPRCRPLRGFVECWAVNVECLMFLLLIFSAMPLCAQTSSNELPALAPSYPELPPTFLERQQDLVKQHGLATLVIASALTALVVGFVWQIFKPRQRPGPLPETIARHALAKLQNRPEDGMLLSEVSQILRRCVGIVYALPGGEMTTAEFCDAVARNEKINPEVSKAISSFLRECDVRKFSPANSAAQVNAVSRALEFITRLESEFRQRDACATEK